MKGLLKLLHKARPALPVDKPESEFFSTAFSSQGVDAHLLVPWEARAVEVGAVKLSPSRAVQRLQDLWAQDKYMSHLPQAATRQLVRFLDFATVAAKRDLIRQDEHGDFMLVLLSGSMAVERSQPWGERLRLAEAVPGEILGEMSLLDSGKRFSFCTSLSECEIAILSAQALDEMLATEPRLAASLIALLARKMSLRLRLVSARLSDKR